MISSSDDSRSVRHRRPRFSTRKTREAENRREETTKLSASNTTPDESEKLHINKEIRKARIGARLSLYPRLRDLEASLSALPDAISRRQYAATNSPIVDSNSGAPPNSIIKAAQRHFCSMTLTLL
jgi:hypothetical protein